MKRYGVFFMLTALVLVCALFCFREGFYGMSPGTLTQLASSHVPTQTDIAEAAAERIQVRKDIYDMTESDLF
jgi:hypothetical protein